MLKCKYIRDIPIESLDLEESRNQGVHSHLEWTLVAHNLCVTRGRASCRHGNVSILKIIITCTSPISMLVTQSRVRDRNPDIPAVSAPMTQWVYC